MEGTRQRVSDGVPSETLKQAEEFESAMMVRRKAFVGMVGYACVFDEV